MMAATSMPVASKDMLAMAQILPTGKTKEALGKVLLVIPHGIALPTEVMLDPTGMQALEPTAAPMHPVLTLVWERVKVHHLVGSMVNTVAHPMLDKTMVPTIGKHQQRPIRYSTSKWIKNVRWGGG